MARQNRIRAAALVVLGAALAACSASPRVELRAHRPGDVAGVGSGGWYRGWGVAIDERRVVTPAHVVGGADHVLARQVWVDGSGRVRRRGRWRRAEVIGHGPAERVEPLAALVVYGERLEPAELGALQPGDSGTPVYGAGGEVIGLLWGDGADPHGRPVLVAVPVRR